MSKQHGFIDADSHILEPDDIWERYLDPEFRDEMPKTRCWYEGEQSMGFGFTIDVGGYNMPIGVPHMLTVLPGLPARTRSMHAKAFRRGCTKPRWNASGWNTWWPTPRSDCT